MEQITKELQKHFQGKYNYLKLLEVKYDSAENLCTVVLMFPETISRLTDAEEQEIEAFVTSLFNLEQIKLKVAFKKSFLDKAIVANQVLAFLKQTYASFATGIGLADIEAINRSGTVHVTLKLSSQQYSFFRERNISVPLHDYLLSQFCGNFIIEPQIAKTEEVKPDIAMQRQQVLQRQSANELGQNKVMRYEVVDPVVLIGSEITPKPEFVQNISQTKARAILAGTVENLQEKVFTAKKGKKDENGAFPQKKYISFTLHDPTARLRCVHFCSKSNEKKLAKLKEGASILVLADVEVQEGKPSSCVVRDISFCTLKSAAQSIESTIFDASKHSYTVAIPKPYVSNVQVDIFAKKQEPNSYLKQNTFVVFDVETTGLDADTCEITEIGAAKVQNGVITQTFQTLVKPKGTISYEITQITGITNAMVQDAPSIDHAIKDFALFASGGILVAHNLSFDIRFIQSAGRKHGILFDNEKLDTLSFVKSKMYLTNYKLGTIVKELKIDLTNAHRALFDAVATAEVLIKLNQT